MRIWLAVNAALDPQGGAPGTVMQLGGQLAARGHEVEVFGHETVRPPWRRAAHHLFALALLRRLRRGPAPDVIDASGSEAWAVLLAGAGRRRGGRPAVVVRSHGIEHRYYAAYRDELRRGYPREMVVPRLGLLHRALRLPEVRLCVRRCDRLVCVSEQERDYVLARGWRAAEGISVVNNGVDDIFFGAPARPPGRQRVLLVSSWIFMKGVRYFAAAMSRLLAGRPGAQVSLVGTGDVPAETVLAGFERAVRGRVRLLPSLPRPELAAELRGHDVFVNPSLMESFGNALAEAMAAGLACVSTPFGAAGDLGRDGVNLLLVPPADPEAIAAKVGWLLDNPSERARLGTAAAAAAEPLRWPAVVGRTEEVYRQAMEEAARA